MRIDRMLAITVMLLNRDRISARELAEKFEVSVRTVYRDIDAINMAGIPVISYAGNNGGFGIMPNYRLERQLLTFDSMVSILSALRGVNDTLGDDSLDGAIEKITNLVPRERVADLKSRTDRIVMDIMPWGYTSRQRENIQCLHAAVAGNSLIEFEYWSYRGDGTIRTVEPMTLVFKGYAWYLFGYCLMRNDYRLFKLSRMRNIRVTDRTFVRRERSFRDYEKVVESSPRKEVELVLRFAASAKSRVEDMFHDDDITVEEDGRLTAAVTFPKDEWIVSFVLSFGATVEVISPANIREKVKQAAGEIAALYRD